MLLTLLCLSFGLSPSPAAEVRMRLIGQLSALADDVKAALKSDPRLQGQRLSLGSFAPQGKKVKETNYGLRIEREFKSLLKSELNDESKLVLAGSYHFVDSESPDNAGAEVLVITAQIQNDRGKELAAFTREVNDTDDIRVVLGLTGAGTTDPKATFKQRNDQLKQDAAKPQFEVIAGDRVAASGRTQYSVRVLKKSKHDGPTSPVPPQNVNGLAYVPLGIHDYYELELFNDDPHSDAVAVITVDGLDVANTFSTDMREDGSLIVWPGFFVPRAANGHPGRSPIRGWLNTIDQKRKDNVFTFLIAELGQGAASALKKRGAIGVITVQFYEACPVDGKLRRSFGETAKGEGLEEKFSTKQLIIGDNAQSTVSIRYNLPE
jgi:hypothetical protein